MVLRLGYRCCRLPDRRQPPHEFAEWEEGELAVILEHLRSEGVLEGVGYDGAQIDELLAEMAAASKDVLDPGPGAPPKEPVSRTGDLWLLGEHRLLYGDSTSKDDMGRLMGGEKSTLLATDPPYLVNYRGSSTSKPKLDGTEVDAEHWDDYEGDVEGLAFSLKSLSLIVWSASPYISGMRTGVKHRNEPIPVSHVVGRQLLGLFGNV